MVNLVTIGTNFVVDMFMDGALQVPELNVLGACSRSEENARRVAEKYSMERIYTSHEELAADADVDAVWIATPNICHLEHAKFFLEHGKHVFLEKPAVTSMADYEDLMACASVSGKVLMEAMRPVHGPAIEKLRELMGEIGTVRRARLALDKYSSRYSAFRAGDIQNAFNPALQNSSMMDMGCYTVQVMLALFGVPKAIKATSIFMLNGFEGEGSITCEFDEMIADVSYGKISTSHLSNEIQGEDGSIVFDSVGEPAHVELWLREKDEPQVFEDVFGPHPMQFECEDFCRAVAGELDPAPFHKLTEETIRLMEEARAQTGVTFG